MFGFDMSKIGEMAEQVEEFFDKVTSSLTKIIDTQRLQAGKLERIEYLLNKCVLPETQTEDNENE